LRSEVSPAGKSFGLEFKHLRIVLTASIALKMAVLFILAWNRRFVMDEFVQFGSAKNIGQIATLATTQIKAQGYVPFFELAHLIGWNARSMLLLGRMEMALLACGTLAIVYALARSLGESKVRSALIVLILLSFSNFIERIFETRGDPMSVFFAAAALLVAIRARDRRWWIIAAGVLSGLAFLSTQKAVYFNLALGLALVGDAALERRFAHGISRGVCLVLGWLVPIAAYCLILGGSDPLAVGHNLFFGPLIAASPEIAAEYRGLRNFVLQTLELNAGLYVFCFEGMVLAVLQMGRLDCGRRVALIFSVIITVLVFTHNQPWPYVFIMALPFIALWAMWPFDLLAAKPVYLRTAWAVLAIAIASSFVKNVLYLPINNHNQLALISRAESLLAPDDVYFDGVGMLPNRREPSTLWLDQHEILQTLHERQASEAYRIFSVARPKLILWSHDLDMIEPVVGPLIRNSYAQVAPNIRMAGAALAPDRPVTFEVPIPAIYAVYDLSGRPIQATLEVNGRVSQLPVRLRRGAITVRLRSGASKALLLPQGSYAGKFSQAGDDKTLFADVYR
jgi:hypothetical protein